MSIEGENKYTVADIEALPERERAELIDGEMFMMAAPALVHQDMLMWLGTRIRNYIAEHKGECRVLPAPFAVYIKKDQYNYVEPDISVVCDRDKLDNKGCHGAPEFHSFSEQVRVDIYEDLMIDFSEYLGDLEELNQDIE